MSCNHSRREDTPAGYRCLKCGREVRSRGRSPVLHGTMGGYEKHANNSLGRGYKELQEGWEWPPCESCAAAQREYGRAKRRRPEVASRNKQSSSARARAFQRLQAAHPAEYARFYAEELSVLTDGGRAARAGMEKEIEMFLLPLGCTQEKLRVRCAAGEASPFERDVMRKVLAVGRRMIDLEVACEKEKSRRAG